MVSLSVQYLEEYNMKAHFHVVIENTVVTVVIEKNDPS